MENKMNKVTFLILLLLGTLAEAGANEGITPLMLATIRNSTVDVKTLITEGASVNAQNEYGVTALMYAGAYRAPEVALILVKAGAQINLVDEMGKTALMYSVEQNGPISSEVKVQTFIELLVGKGADKSVKDSNQMMAYSYAVLNRFPAEITALLR